jgi:hypothetical protein
MNLPRGKTLQRYATAAAILAALVGYLILLKYQVKYPLSPEQSSVTTEVKTDFGTKITPLAVSEEKTPETHSGLVGRFYDFKRTPDRRPSDVQGRSSLNNLLTTFVRSNWDENLLMTYFRAKDPITTCQFFIPVRDSAEAPKAFGVGNEVKPLNWAALYKGSVVAAIDTTFRFRGRGDNYLMVRFNQKNVFFNSLQDRVPLDLFPGNQPKAHDRSILSYGPWIHVEKGKKYPVEILLSDYGGVCSFILCVEELHPDPQMPDGKQPSVYPLFQLEKGIPLPPYSKSTALEKIGAAPEVTTNQSIFTVR